MCAQLSCAFLRKRVVKKVNVRKRVIAVEKQIDILNTTDLIYNDSILKIEHKLIFSMVDRKVNLFLYILWNYLFLEIIKECT